MNDIYENKEEYNANKKRKILIIFGEMIADMLSNKKLNLTVTELFIRTNFIKAKYFFCFYHTENSKQTRDSTNCK